MTASFTTKSNIYLSNAHYVPGTVLGSGQQNEQDRQSVLSYSFEG